MDISKLKYFCSVANHLNFSRAAKECCIAQTAMSRYISSLEEELGFQLFYRNRHKVELTPAGKQFFNTAVKIINDLSLAQQAGIELASGSKGQLCIGFGGFDICHIRKYLPKFIELHPDYQIVLREYPYDSIADALTSNECDVVFSPNSRLVKHTQLRKHVTSNSNNQIALGSKHPLFNRHEVDPSELNGETFICAYDVVHSWFQLRQFERTCSEYGIVPGHIIYTNTAIALMTMVEQNIGIAFITEGIHRYATNIHLIPITGEHQVKKLSVVACNTPAENPLAIEFMDYIANFKED